ncbi:MAG: thioesterase [Alphaproteobacteria bacterium]|nr:thioesterase [Alphaproteobacteria bacterium]
MAELFETYRGAVYPWHCDHMGHMNVMWYVGKFDEATWQLFAGIGVTAKFLSDNRRGMAAVEQRIAYRREVLAGEVLAVRSGILEAKDKAIRFVHEMREVASGDLAAVTTLVGVQLDTETRRSVPFPAEIRARAAARLVDYPLPWNA